MGEHEFVIRVDGRGVDGDAGSILFYCLGDCVSLVATVEKNGDAEAVLAPATTASLDEALRGLFDGKK